MSYCILFTELCHFYLSYFSVLAAVAQKLIRLIGYLFYITEVLQWACTFCDANKTISQEISSQAQVCFYINSPEIYG